VKTSIMTRSRGTGARWIARSMTAVLWGAGSAYLIGHALDQQPPNFIEIATIPILWAAVLAAPIVAHVALHNRELLAAGFLAIAAIVGSAWTLSGTIARQSQGADETVAAAVEADKARKALGQKLAEAQEILAGHRAAQAKECASGKGKKCDGVSYTVATWDAAVKGYEAKLEKLPAPKAPNAGVRRIAAFVALMPGVTKSAAQIEPHVALVAPCLFGLFIELAALAFGFYGFAPRGNRATVAEPRRLRAIVAATVANDDQPTPPRPGNHRTVASKARAEADVIEIVARGQMLPNQDELASLWGRHKGTVSKWCAEFERRGLIVRHIDGRNKRVAAA